MQSQGASGQMERAKRSDSLSDLRSLFFFFFLLRFLQYVRDVSDGY